MSIKSSLVKLAIKCTPNAMVIWVANIILKGFAELLDFNFDIDARKAYVQIRLHGEEVPIEVWLEDFAVLGEAESHQFILHQAQSNKPWLNHIFKHIAGKTWNIPAIPQFASEIELVAELLKAEPPAPQELESESESE